MAYIKAMKWNISSILYNSKFKEFIRFGIVGVVAVIIHYGIYMLLLLAMGIDWRAAAGTSMRTNLAYTIGYAVSLVCNLWLTAHYTFKEKITIKRTGGFVLSHVINYFIHIVLLNVYLWMGVAEWLAPFLVLLIAVPINFILVRTAFKKL